MNFGQMQDTVRRKLNEATSVFYTDDDIQTAINDGYFELADATEFYEREAMVPFIKRHTYYDLSLILPDTFLSPRRCYNPRTSMWLLPTTPRQVDREWAQWETVDGEPEQYFLRGNWWLGVFPRPTRDSEGLRFVYTAIPPKLCVVTDEPLQMPREFHPGIVSFAMADLLGQERETNKALQWWSDYKVYEGRLQAYVEGRTALAGRPKV